MPAPIRGAIATLLPIKVRTLKRPSDRHLQPHVVPADVYFHNREDLLRVRKRVGNGTANVVLPETTDGRHCDYAPSLALAMSRWLKEPVQQRDPTEHERLRAEIERSKKALAKKYGQKRERWN